MKTEKKKREYKSVILSVIVKSKEDFQNEISFFLLPHFFYSIVFFFVYSLKYKNFWNV